MNTDKRVIKTRLAIKNAFMLLTFEKEKDKISVSDIAEKAGINRSTFYLHYNNVSEVIKDIENEIETEISACIESFDSKDIYGSTYAIFTSLTQALNSKETVKRYITESTASKYLAVKLKEIFVNKSMTVLKNYNNGKVNEQTYYSIVFIVAGIMDVYLNWVNSKNTNITLEELIEMVSTLVQPLLNYLNLI